MTKRRYQSRLDMIGIVILTIAALLFILSATAYLLSVIILAVHGGPPPLFTLGEIGTLLGIGGMIMVPLFIITTLAAGLRARRKKTGNDIDDNSERRAAERGRPDREDG